MPYVDRKDGRIVAVYETPQREGHELATREAVAEFFAPRVPTYRELRKPAYRDRLGKDQGDFVNTIGDILDVVIAELRARGEPATAAFRALVAEIDAIKAEFPKPEGER